MIFIHNTPFTHNELYTTPIVKICMYACENRFFFIELYMLNEQGLGKH